MTIQGREGVPRSLPVASPFYRNIIAGHGPFVHRGILLARAFQFCRKAGPDGEEFRSCHPPGRLLY
jgi:hypothetical protein